MARSVFQVEPGDRNPDALSVRVRHKKVNFGPKLDPFDVRLEFSAGKIATTVAELDDIALVTEGTVNGIDRLYMALASGPGYPDELAERTKLDVGTVRNYLTRLKQEGKVEYTGERQGKACQVQRTSLPSSSSSDYKENDDDDVRAEPWQGRL